MIQAHIDTATYRHGPDGSCIVVAGWSFAKQGHIIVVRVQANGEVLGYVPFGFPRADVARHFGPDCPTANVGFEGPVPLPPQLSQLASVELCFTFMSSALERLEVVVKVPKSSALQALPTPSPIVSHEAPMVITASARAAAAKTKLAAPNFFILGAAKCGTTSLHHALKQHPQIHLPEVKEPSFFSSGFQVVSNPIDYFNLFPERARKTRYGEASHVYFSAPEAAPVLRQLFPEAKFILILRHPVSRAYSLYHHMRRAGNEPLNTFEQALDAEESRYTDLAFERDCGQYFWNFMYYRSSLYDVQLARYLELFRRDQFLVLTLGEWKADPERRLKEMFQFLGVDSAAHVKADPQNQADGYAPMSDETRRKLTTKFDGMRERLEEMIGRKLQHWDC